uniref:SH3 domain-containing protein n=1 Tax=Lates calcarifer TaxID=8187 RepID=A0A4W6FK92_LATCA
MAVSQVNRIPWITVIVFVIFPHVNLGLLSDYKICGDSECESLMSRVQAIRDHHGKDCRFLSFQRGDTIFVYHKLTGKREDLWAGTIDKQFGYFPKDAVEEEQIYATAEKVVETQRSDFFCLDEYGYPIDSSDLDNGDENDDQKIQIQESGSTQTIPHTDDTNAGSPSASADHSTESPVSAQQSDGEENKNTGDAAAGTHEEPHENSAALNEQGGSPSSSWLGSSVTGWLGLGEEEESGKLTEEEIENEREETQAKTLTSSVTGWLGFGGEGKPDDAVKSREDDKETADSFASTMTGWLSFGRETKTDSAINENDGEREMEEEHEPEVKFRSRRMSLDLEGSQLHEEEKKEMGTLDWLGNGLSQTLGFGVTNQGSGDETNGEREAGETMKEEKEQSASSSWLDMGIGGILGFRKDESEVDERTGRDFKETMEEKTLGQEKGSENIDTSQTQPDQSEPDIQRLEKTLVTEMIPEVGDNSINSSSNKDTNQSNIEEQDQVSQSETEAGSATLAPVEDSGDDASDAASEVDQKDISPQTKLEEKSQAVDEISSIISKERSSEIEGERHQMPKSLGNEGSKDNNREPGEEEIKSTSDTDSDFLTQSDINRGPEFSSVDLNSDSTGQSVGKTEEDQKTGSGDEEGAEILSVNDAEGEGSTEETDVLHREISTTQTEESAEQSQGSGITDESSGKSLPLLSSGTAEERNEPVHGEDEITAHTVKADDDSDTPAVIDNNIDTQTHRGDLGDEAEVQPDEGTSQRFGLFDSTKISPEKATSESTTQVENYEDQEFVSSQDGAESHKR